ncbi:MAG TPA: RdgB/HAM1 family non-canonical purine NTP pyrophosphatase [Candidatus Acidoferrales bacterium]|jgi:XTP/dITP diphosphohydrolase|nr:RdgB/HAM1 family non-canonical purine NTP pyrophosphatase [Candidatus Acidoferrales bacterium]
MKFILASSNPGKLREYRELAGDSAVELGSIPNFFEIPAFEESAPTFAENAAGKAMYYSRFSNEIVLADDSGLVVPALNGAPGVHSARYAGPKATDQDRVHKLLREMEGKTGDQRCARFICVTAVAKQGRLLAIASDFAQGVLTEEPRGSDGFGYDPIFLFSRLGRTYAELTRKEKNLYSHRGKAFRKIVSLVDGA